VLELLHVLAADVENARDLRGEHSGSLEYLARRVLREVLLLDVGRQVLQAPASVTGRRSSVLFK
jgi:hypothetical protein